MKFLVDAQLPRRLAYWLQEQGHGVIHTRDLPQGNRTTDSMINDISLRDNRVVVTKDDDFVHSVLLHRKPYKLLLVSTGNIKNEELELVFQKNISQIVEALTTFGFVEIDRTRVIVHA